MKILRYSLGQLQANSYFLIDDGNCLIIDPADDAVFLLEEVHRRKLKLMGMLATHGHFDHIMATGEIQLSYSIPLHIHIKDKFLVQRLKETAKYFLGYDPHIIDPAKLEFISHGEFRISSFSIQIMHTPGHTPGSICLYFKNDQALFTGDLLFKNGIGRYDFSYSSRNNLQKSLENILKLPKITEIYPGHGMETTIDEESKNIIL
ncbi:MAG: Metallo-beta-lactamase family protein [Candidatus Roizmanbacteria bacterium GW2011_GWA2_36_23]|uniref:Metallo-beta-lactamase family protein n=1 Tax=Candidatus Roizmanbacteria bacterium GW2011_GWA2_36_23 TaxID=1618480 RepID=A0A0G0E9D2_9BACT|nr:MAG: Metallo-beta-lactamase family protein [Candidatus Roizmanbacteria bacterium GW2011_GWA2_36_23]